MLHKTEETNAGTPVPPRITNTQARVHMTNSRTVLKFFDVMESKIKELVKIGAIRRVQEKEEVYCVAPLACVEQDGKVREIFNGRFPNLFMRDKPFVYEKIWYLMANISPGDLVDTSDEKQGYY